MDGLRPPTPNPLPRSWGRGQGEGVYVRQDQYGNINKLFSLTRVPLFVKLDRCNKKFAHSGHGSKWAKNKLTKGLPPFPSLYGWFCFFHIEEVVEVKITEDLFGINQLDPFKQVFIGEVFQDRVFLS